MFSPEQECEHFRQSAVQTVLSEFREHLVVVIVCEVC